MPLDHESKLYSLRCKWFWAIGWMEFQPDSDKISLKSIHPMLPVAINHNRSQNLPPRRHSLCNKFHNILHLTVESKSDHQQLQLKSSSTITKLLYNCSHSMLITKSKGWMTVMSLNWKFLFTHQYSCSDISLLKCHITMSVQTDKFRAGWTLRSKFHSVLSLFVLKRKTLCISCKHTTSNLWNG